MAKADKLPRVYRVVMCNPEAQEEHRYGRVYISAYKVRQLPLWVCDRLSFWSAVYDVSNPNAERAYITIRGHDELQVLMRFNKLWAGLPKE